ncbi:MAG: cupin domain-containing protein [Chloroflexi bacterium]|nr:cupin domain-containing protein [Chloroflexota bacterium]
MARAGDVIENQVSGERFTFRKTAAETDGQLLQFELALRPGGRVPIDHIHSKQEERFEVISGRATFRVGKTERELTAGESVVVPPGTAHSVRNDSGEETRIAVEFRPAMSTEFLFEAICRLAGEGKVSRSGLPNPLRMAVVARSLRDETYMAGVPVALQRAGIAVMAPLGRLLRYGPPLAGHDGGE